ncbi:MAG: hypothetical protein QOG36_673, partial [Actinomycetota bacterium]|nr:hypothetical protein [Actinomycetota bacterium]
MAARRFISWFGAFSAMIAGGGHGQQRALGARGADAAEAIVGQIEQSQALDAFAQNL